MDGSDDDPEARVAALFDAHHQRLFRLARRLSASADDRATSCRRRSCAPPRAASVPVAPQRGSLAGARADQRLPRLLAACGGARRAVAAGHVPRRGRISPEPALLAQSMVWQALDALPPRRRAISCSTSSKGTPSGDRAAAGRHARHRSLASDARAPRDGKGARGSTMNHWKARLREADRALTSDLSPEETQRLRRTRRRSGVGGAFAAPVVAAFAVTAGSLTAASALWCVALTALPGATAPRPAIWRSPARSRRARRTQAVAVSSFNSQHRAARGSSGSSTPNSR